MFSWLAANLGTVLVGALLPAVIVGVIALMHRDKARRKNSCAHGCDHCAMHGQCRAPARAVRK